MLRRTLFFLGVLVLLSLAVTGSARAQTNVVWSGTYYNNGSLSGTPALSRTDTSIAFNWGTGAPDAAVNTDGFSVRWATDVVLNAGTYRFWALADDQISITVDFSPTPLINTFGQNLVGQLVSADITLGAGSHHIQVNYVEVTASAFAYVSFGDIATSGSGPNFGAPGGQPVSGGLWSAQYYPNTALSGSPVLIQSEGFPGRDWGAGSPIASIPVDGWSARWTGTLTLNAGTYSISARPDDGVRVFVNGVLVINEWHDATGATYGATLPLNAGPNTFVVEFYENLGVAFLDFRITQNGVPVVGATPVPTPPSQPTGVTVTVRAGQLNVRNAPSTSGAILSRISQNQVFPALGINPARTWVQINANGTVGWVSSAWVILNNTSLPVITDTTPLPVLTVQPPTSGPVVTAAPYNVRIRLGPGTQFGDIARLRAGQSAVLIGRNASNTWWQINFNGIIGWVSASFTPVQGGVDLNTIPITG